MASTSMLLVCIAVVVQVLKNVINKHSCTIFYIFKMLVIYVVLEVQRVVSRSLF